ncbi:MAG: hypothetical protein C0404_14460 [Verrucomicrobia bacterium]|nr:hypothetical protein [Verrucomicrobiota bacterium]
MESNMKSIVIPVLLTLAVSTLALGAGGPTTDALPVTRPVPGAPAPTTTVTAPRQETTVAPDSSGESTSSSEPAPAAPRISSFSGTSDENAIAGAFVGMATGGGGGRASPDATSVFDEINSLPADELGRAIDQMSPAGNDSITRAGRDIGRRQSDTVNDHLDDVRIGEGSGREGSGAGIPWSPWGLGIFNDTIGPLPDTGENYHSRSLGASAGLDWRINSRFLAGVHLGYTETRLNYTGSSRGEIDALSYGLYGAFILGDGHIQGGVDQSDQAFNNSRHIKFGRVARTATSSHDGRGRAAFLSGGYDFAFGAWGVSPMASLRHTIQKEDAYTESGADSLDLDVDRQQSEGTDSYIGLRIDHGGLLMGVRTTQRLTAGWGHNFNTGGRRISAGFSGSGGDHFTVTGPDGDADGLELSGGLTASFLGFTAFADFGYSRAGDTRSQSVMAGVRSIF